MLREVQHTVLGLRENVNYFLPLLGYGEENDDCGG
jgi:hypothetical protein